MPSSLESHKERVSPQEVTVGCSVDWWDLLKRSQWILGWIFVGLVAPPIILGMMTPWERPIDGEDFQQIEKGMTKEEVANLLGPPTNSSSGHDRIIYGSNRSIWVRSDFVIIVEFSVEDDVRLDGCATDKAFFKHQRNYWEWLRDRLGIQWW